MFPAWAGVIPRMTINSDAKILEIKDLVDKTKALIKIEASTKNIEERRLVRNIGRKAAMDGYDVVYIKEKKYYLVLNRGILVVEDE
jgi:hypothetical protein